MKDLERLAIRIEVLTQQRDYLDEEIDLAEATLAAMQAPELSDEQKAAIARICEDCE